jgi:LuxR family maltose regulon positive regulatory protein
LRILLRRVDRPSDPANVELARQVGRLLQEFGDPARPVRVPGLVEQLSPRELEVLRLVAVGKPNQQIADELFVTQDTVKKHVTHVLGKLGVVNRTQAAARGRALGLLEEEQEDADVGQASAARFHP